MATSRGKKTGFGLSALAVVLLLLLLLGSCGEDCEDEQAATPRATVTATVTATPSPIGESVDDVLKRVKQTGLRVGVHDASEHDETPSGNWMVCFEKATLSKVVFAAVPPGAPCPSKDGERIPWPKMPDVKGVTYGKAMQMLADAPGSVVLDAAYRDEDAHDQDNESGYFADWKICFQDIQAGRTLDSDSEITLHGVQKGDACPPTLGLYKDTSNDPDNDEPAPDSDSDYGPGSSDDDSNSGESDNDGSDYYPGEKGGCPPGGCYNPCPPWRMPVTHNGKPRGLSFGAA